MNAPPDPGVPDNKIRSPHRSAWPLDVVLRTWGAVVLVFGLVAAVLIAVFASGTPSDDLADRIAQGRMYRHNLELMGGSMGVLIDDFDRWFGSLWHGRALAGTIAALAIAIALVCFAAAHLARTAQSEAQKRAAETDRP